MDEGGKAANHVPAVNKVNVNDKVLAGYAGNWYLL